MNSIFALLLFLYCRPRFSLLSFRFFYIRRFNFFSLIFMLRLAPFARLLLFFPLSFWFMIKTGFECCALVLKLKTFWRNCKSEYRPGLRFRRNPNIFSVLHYYILNYRQTYARSSCFAIVRLIYLKEPVKHKRQILRRYCLTRI